MYIYQKFRKIIYSIRFTIPLYHLRRSTKVFHSHKNFFDVVFEDQMHQLLFVQCPLFQHDKMGNPKKIMIEYNIMYFQCIIINCWLKCSYRNLLTCLSESTCHDVRHGVHRRCPQGSILISLSFSAQILQSWNVLPVNI